MEQIIYNRFVVFFESGVIGGINGDADWDFNVIAGSVFLDPFLEYHLGVQTEDVVAQGASEFHSKIMLTCYILIRSTEGVD